MMQAQVERNLYALAESEPVKIQPGQKVRVLYSLSYKVADTATLSIWGSLYTKTLGAVNRIEQAQTKTTITLEKSITGQTYEDFLDITVGAGVKAGQYGLIVELPGFENAAATIDDCIEVAGTPGIMEMLPALMTMMMLGMVVPMMEEAE
jgi:hypothetical protein